MEAAASVSLFTCEQARGRAQLVVLISAGWRDERLRCGSFTPEELMRKPTDSAAAFKPGCDERYKNAKVPIDSAWAGQRPERRLVHIQAPISRLK